jgi:hypothetical protein
MVDGELALVMNVGDGVVDDAQWTTAASVIVGELGRLREKAGQTITRRSRERGEGGGARGEEGMLHRVRIDGDWWRKLRAPVSDSSSLAAPNREGKVGERSGGAGLYSGGS